MKTIKFELTEEMLAPYGVTSDEIADACGYMETIPNPDYVPAVGSKTITDPKWSMPEGFDINTEKVPQIDNPDYVPAVGEPTIANVSRTVWLAPIILQKGLEWCIAQVTKVQLNQIDAQRKQVERIAGDIATTLAPKAVKEIIE